MSIDNAAIYALIDEVPKGEVASYGMIASLLSGVGPRQVARAMRFAPKGLPWFRIITSSGALADHAGAEKQRRRLKREGVTFRRNGSVDWAAHSWRGPSPVWIAKTGADPTDIMEIVSGWKR
ncbi:MAG: hypothetical protein DHS20C05_10780 [Hyphococcus sp.]|nr:MAG: hypothetical protein DHS20C05_10780 [Marinicaulis sp.]